MGKVIFAVVFMSLGAYLYVAAPRWYAQAMMSQIGSCSTASK